MNETELLLTQVLNCDRLCLYLHKDMLLDKAKTSFISCALKRRIRGEPIQYILGKTEFMGLDFRVVTGVFIPRPETEILVEKVLEMVKVHGLGPRALEIMDVGTGSGNIAISLAKFLKDCRILAVDISQEAINVARNNALLNNVTSKINFINQDFFNLQLLTYNLEPFSFDFIVSNPPYIPAAEIKLLQPEVRYEPRIALDGGKDGLDFYRRIIKEAPSYLKNNGFLIMEIGFKQKGAIKNIFQKSRVFEIIECIKDYNNIDRVMVAQKKRRYG